MFGYVFHDTSGPNHGKVLKIPWYLLNETFVVIQWPDWARQFEKCSMEESTELGMHVRSSKTMVISVSVDDITKAGKNQNMAPMWKKIDETCGH